MICNSKDGLRTLAHPTALEGRPSEARVRARLCYCAAPEKLTDSLVSPVSVFVATAIALLPEMVVLPQAT